MTSRRSTTASVTPLATGSCSRSPSASRRASAPPTRPRGSAGTSSRSCSRTSHDPQAAVETAERILDSLARPLELDDNDLVIRASLGISVVEPGNATDADELIRNADAAMYIAKAEGKGGYRLFEPAMHDRVVARLALRADLQRALEREEFELHYQPLVRLVDEAVTGVEALLRWRHPVRGLIPPVEFIPFAEETGLIVEIGRWVLREGCRQAKVLRQQITGPTRPTIGINLSVKQLFHSDIIVDVANALAEAELEPEALTLEITESVMMTDTELAISRLKELRALGVRLAMDDFGTGYSSLSSLSMLPLDILKMDRSLLAAGASPVTSGLAERGPQPRRDVCARGRRRGHRVPRAVGHAQGTSAATPARASTSPGRWSPSA